MVVFDTAIYQMHFLQGIFKDQIHRAPGFDHYFTHFVVIDPDLDHWQVVMRFVNSFYIGLGEGDISLFSLPVFLLALLCHLRAVSIFLLCTVPNCCTRGSHP